METNKCIAESLGQQVELLQLCFGTYAMWEVVGSRR